MSLLQWKDEYVLGIPDVDHEHKELIDWINRLHGLIQDKDDAETINSFLGEIYARISAHFALEEKIMRESNYEEYREHKADHERLLDEILDIMDEQLERRSLDSEKLAGHLENWFGAHFRTMDARMHHKLEH